MELTLLKLAGVLTAVEFLWATKYYFRRRANLPATLGMTVFILAVVILHAVFLVLANDTPPLQCAIAMAFFGLSNLLFWSALVSHGAMRPSAVFGETIPDALVHSGPYRVMRHPFYLAYVFAFVGSALVGNHWVLFLATLGLFVCYDRAARSEERLLANTSGPIGEAYAHYLQTSWRWLPFIW
jgi:protein-S-isoprenylcysteine O-methyltransferase Ste14